MTKQEQKEYLQKYVASQGTQAGLSITPLLEAIINGNVIFSLLPLRTTPKTQRK